MMKLTITAIALLFICSCATTKYHDRDLENPAYYEGVGIPISDSLSVGGAGNGGAALYNPPITRSAPEALIESGISLAAYPDYYKASTISGTCLIGEAPLEQVPCRHFAIHLIHSDGHELGTTETNDAGQFAFRVKKDAVYFLRISNSRYIQIEDRSGPLTMGAKIILLVKPKP